MLKTTMPSNQQYIFNKTAGRK